MQEYLCLTIIITAAAWLGYRFYIILWPKKAKNTGCGGCGCDTASKSITKPNL